MAAPFTVEERGFMREALSLAEKALGEGEFPVGCVLVSGGAVVGRGRRRRSRGEGANELDHAEILALRDWLETGAPGKGRLVCYTTLEPCLMCFGALALHGVRRVVFAFEDVMGGARRALPPKGPGGLYAGLGSRLQGGLLREESAALLSRFFERYGDYWAESELARSALSAGGGAGAH